MKLPAIRKTVKAKFWSLRRGIGASLGVLDDIDALVERNVYRKKTETGWQWQINNLKSLSSRDFYAQTDQDSLDELGEVALEFKLIT